MYGQKSKVSVDEPSFVEASTDIFKQTTIEVVVKGCWKRIGDVALHRLIKKRWMSNGSRHWDLSKGGQ